MSFREDHELHKRRRGRNVGVGIMLILFVALVYGVTVVKARENGIPDLQTEVTSE